MIARRAAAAALALAILASCAPRPAPAPEPRRPAVTPPVVIRPLFPADYVAMAASIDLFAIRASELALQRATGPRVRAVAQEMVDAHRGTSAQLSFGGRRLNLVPPAVMRPEHQALFDQLAATSAFDALYVRHLRSVHDQSLRVHAAFAERGESPTLRTVAANAAPVERRHLTQLRGL